MRGSSSSLVPRKFPIKGRTDIRRPVISHNTYIHRIARLAVRPLVDTPITPNQITTVRLAAAMAAAAAMAIGEPSWTYAGAGIFLFSMFLDRADGELARLSGKSSAFGHKLDLISDSASNAMAFVGIGIGLRASELGMWAPVMGLIAGAAVASVLWFVMRLEDTGGERAGEISGFAGADPDDAIIIVPIVLFMDGAQPLLIAAVIGAPAFALFFYFLFRRALKTQSGDGS
jgi:archaetidylinositol phosphate synthase